MKTKTTGAEKPQAHTPGPWTLHPRVKLDPPLIYADGVTVATVNTSAPEPGEREANARLIAAAPELLAAAMDAISRCVYCAGARDANLINECQSCAKLRAAIVKATGQGGI